MAGALALYPEIKKLTAYTDGASRGNPGKAGVGVVIYDQKGEVLEEKSVYLGEATNNIAEYRALLCALQIAEKRGAEEFQVFSDSELVVKQVNGQYRVKNPSLLVLYREVMQRISALKSFSIHHIPRSENRRADRLANRGIDSASE